MPSRTKRCARGRPQTHPVDRVRTRLWFSALKQVSGLHSAYAIELSIDSDRVKRRDKELARPRKWDRYAKGDTVPADKAGSMNAIERAEIKYPGTARWFRSPLWSLLRGESLGADQIDSALRSLGHGISSILFEAPIHGDTSQPRMREFLPESVRILSRIGGFDALAAAVLLVALSEVIASPQLRERALQLYAELQAPLQEMTEFSPLYRELFPLIDGRCTHWWYITPNHRIEIVIPWQKTPIDVAKRYATRFDNNAPRKT